MLNLNTLRNHAAYYNTLNRADRAAFLRSVVLPVLDSHLAKGCREATKFDLWKEALRSVRA